MRGIWIARLLNLKRRPMVFLVTTGMTILLAFLLGSTLGGNPTIYVTSDDSLVSREVINKLKSDEDLKVQTASTEEAKDNRDEEMIIIAINDNNFSILSGSKTQYAQQIAVTIRGMYREVLFEQRVLEIGGEEKWGLIKEEIRERKAFEISEEAMDEKQVFRYDSSLQTLFGYMLFFVFYTVSTNVQFILGDKLSGIWNRLKLTSIKKSKLYLAHLSFSFMLGFCQLLSVILLFRYVLGTNMYGGLGKVIVISALYVLFVIAISTLLISLVKNLSQAGVVTSLLAVAFAMLGGAFWPLEIVDSNLLTGLKWISPVYYGMESLKRVTIYGETIGGVTTYLLIMIIFTILLLIVGIYLLERRANRGHSSE